MRSVKILLAVFLLFALALSASYGIAENNASQLEPYPALPVQELILPEPLPEYEATLQLVPTITERYSSGWFHLAGPLNFLDKNNKPIDLPEETAGYFYAYEKAYRNDYVEPDLRTPSCIFLVDSQGNAAIMRLDGTVVTEFIYRKREYEQAFCVLKGYVNVAQRSEGDEYNQKYGVVDLRTGREVIPAVYDELSLFDGFVAARRGDTVYLLDYSGKELYVYPNAYVTIEYYDETTGYGDRTYFEPNEPWEKSWKIDITEKKAYDTSGGYSFYRVGDFTVTKKSYINSFYENYEKKISIISKMTIRDKDGQHLLTCPEQNYYPVYNDQGVFELLVITDWPDLVFLFPDRKVAHSSTEMAIPELIKWPYSPYYDNFIYKNETLRYEAFVYDPGDDSYMRTRFQITVDMDGKVLSTEKFENEYWDECGGCGDYDSWEYANEESPIRYNSKTSYYEYVDTNWKVLIPADTYGHMELKGDFLLAYYNAGRVQNDWILDIYNKDGKLLVKDAWGFTEMRDGKLFIYKNSTTAGWLSANGRFQQLKFLPAVR